MEIVQWVIAHYQDILAIVGALVVAASGIVALTPTPKDDQAVGWIRGMLERFSAVKPEEGVTETSRSNPE